MQLLILHFFIIGLTLIAGNTHPSSIQYIEKLTYFILALGCLIQICTIRIISQQENQFRLVVN